MFYLMLRMLNDDLENRIISKKKYEYYVERLTSMFVTQKNKCII